MRKFLRFSLICLLTTICGTIFADEVTIDFNENYETLFPGMGTSSGSDDNYVSDGDFNSDFTTTAVSGITFTIKASASDAKTKNRLWASNPRLRMYDGTLTIKSENAFSKIVFTLSTNKGLIAKDNKPSSGTLTEPTKQNNATVTWTGEETKELVITIAGNTQFSKAVVTLGAGGGSTVTVKTPEISGTTPFIASTEVTISVPDGGSTYYTTDGTTPSKTNGTAYSGPITITETTTVKAISYDEDDNASEVAEKTFTKEEAPAVETVTLPYEDATLQKFTKNNVKLPSELTYIWSFDSKNKYMKASAYKGGDYESESWLESPIIDLTTAANPVLSFEHATNYFSSVDKAKEEATVWVKEEGGDWKQLEGVAYPEKLSWTFISSGDISLNAYKGKKIQIGFKYMSTAEKAGTWEVKELKVTDGAPVITYTDKTIAEINEMSEDTSDINLKLTNAQVVYVDGNIQYVREGDKAVMFYNLGIDLPVNSILNGEIKVDYDNYYGLHEVKAISDVTNVDGLTITDGEAATPTATTVAELIELKHIADYVVISGVKIVSEEKNYFAVDGDSKIQLFKGIDVSSYADKDKTYDIKALFNNIYKGTAEIQPVEVTEGTSGVNAVTVEKAQNNIRYNLAGQRVDESYKGVVIMNGKKFVVK